MKMIHPGIESTVTTHTAARRLHVSVRHVQRLIQEGALEALDVSSPGSNRATYRILEKSLDSFRADSALVEKSARTDTPSPLNSV